MASDLANLHLRQGPSTSTAILSKYRPGTEVVVLSQASGWGQVIVCSSGATGYMSMQYLVYVRDETETIEGDAPGPERVVYPVQSRMQLFRIFKVERDAAEREVRVEARHIFYDLLGNVVKNEYAPEGDTAYIVTDTATLAALNVDYTVLRDYGDVFWAVRMNINDLTNNFNDDFVLPEAPQYGVGRRG